jgi:hypothetical protein
MLVKYLTVLTWISNSDQVTNTGCLIFTIIAAHWPRDMSHTEKKEHEIWSQENIMKAVFSLNTNRMQMRFSLTLL